MNECLKGRPGSECRLEYSAHDCNIVNFIRYFIYINFPREIAQTHGLHEYPCIQCRFEAGRQAYELPVAPCPSSIPMPEINGGLKDETKLPWVLWPSEFLVKTIRTQGKLHTRSRQRRVVI